MSTPTLLELHPVDEGTCQGCGAEDVPVDDLGCCPTCRVEIFGPPCRTFVVPLDE